MKGEFSIFPTFKKGLTYLQNADVGSTKFLHVKSVTSIFIQRVTYDLNESIILTPL